MSEVGTGIEREAMPIAIMHQEHYGVQRSNAGYKRVLMTQVAGQRELEI